MRLLTHNMLQCSVSAKRCKGPKFPLLIDQGSSQWGDVETEFNSEFLARLLTKIDWPAFAETMERLGWRPLQTPPHLSKPTEENGSESMESDEQQVVSADRDMVCYGPVEHGGSEEWWLALHTALLSKELVSGALTCRGCSHVFPVVDSIPNMLLKEDEL